MKEHPDAATISDDDICKIFEHKRTELFKQPPILSNLIWYYNIFIMVLSNQNESIERSLSKCEYWSTLKLKRIDNYESPIAQTLEMLKELVLASRSRITDHPVYAQKVKEVASKYKTLLEFLLPQDFVSDFCCFQSCIKLKGIHPFSDIYMRNKEVQDEKVKKESEKSRALVADSLFSASSVLYQMIVPET